MPPNTESAPVSSKINAAVREWLDGIEPARPPLARLAAQIVRLRGELGWTDKEIREFDETARHILVRLIDSTALDGVTPGNSLGRGLETPRPR
jgi:hypothetical protein